jgi:DNA-binding CsgD family transcriptional regulator
MLRSSSPAFSDSSTASFVPVLAPAPLAPRVPSGPALLRAVAEGVRRVRRTAAPRGSHAFVLDATPAPRPLLPREHDALRLAGLGCSNKEIAYDLGVSLSTAGRALARAGRVIGVASRIDLAIVAASLIAGTERGTARIVALEGTDAVLLLVSLAASPLWARLSPAEREVAELALAGHRGASIASWRGARSPRTIANQLGRVFRKVGASGRAELAARVISGPSRGWRRTT